MFLNAIIKYGQKCAAASALLQRTFGVNKWVVGLSALGLGLVFWLAACAPGQSCFRVVVIQTLLGGWSYRELRWCWVGAQTDRPDTELLPEEAHQCSIHACAWSASASVVTPVVLLICALSGEPRLLIPTLGPILYSFGWWAMVGPGLPPSAREPASIPVETPA